MKKLYSMYVLFLCMVLTTSLHASTDFPDTPAGEKAQDIVGLFNNKDAQNPVDYAAENFSEKLKEGIASPGSGLNQLKSIFGKVNVIQILESENDKISFVIKSNAHELYLNIQLEVESDKPHLISSIRFIPTGKPSGDSENKSESRNIRMKKKLTEEELKKNLDQYIEGLANKNDFSGTVLIAKNGNPVYTKAVGFAHKGFKVLNKLDTKFNLGSLNKSFTAVAILQLVEKGEIQIDDPIGKYLDYFPKNIAEKVTIRQLLSMRSGWGDYWDNEYFLAHKNQLRTVSDYMEFIKDIPLDFEPGTKMQHCNTGYEVAGAIIEKVSGLDYFDYIVPDKLSKKIKRGQLVSIPFRQKDVNGIVFDLKKETKQNISRLKEVIKINEPLPFLFSWQLS